MEVLSKRPSLYPVCWRLVRIAFALVLLWAALLEAGTASAQVPREYQLKAVFLYNFAQFTEWPSNAFPEAHSPLVIGVLGTDPFGPYLDEAVRGESVNGHPILVERYSRLNEVKNAHILFISQSEASRLDSLLKALKGKPILTVSDLENFALQGGMVRFISINNRIQMRVNLDELKASKLTLSSKLLRAAEIVGTGR